jgi:transcriptional/translational regulatory protein YebC/TACO1
MADTVNGQIFQHRKGRQDKRQRIWTRVLGIMVATRLGGGDMQITTLRLAVEKAKPPTCPATSSTASPRPLAASKLQYEEIRL